jgi:hypothetical protein
MLMDQIEAVAVGLCGLQGSKKKRKNHLQIDNNICKLCITKASNFGGGDHLPSKLKQATTDPFARVFF